MYIIHIDKQVGGWELHPIAQGDVLANKQRAKFSYEAAGIKNEVW